MAEKEQIIFEYQVDMGGALADAERYKKNIIQTKEEQKQLNDAFKKGSVSLDEYVSDSVRLEAILKKEQTAYNDLSKSMTGTKTQTDKLIESNNKLTKSNETLGDRFKNVASEVNIAGTNIGSLSGNITSFINPATAAATIVGTLATAYFNTGRGAQDLEAIQFKLQATTEVLSNKIADLVDKFKDPESSIGKFGRALIDTNPIIQGLKAQFNLLLGDTKEEIENLAAVKKSLKDIELAQLDAQKVAKVALDQAEQRRRIRDDESKSDAERLAAAKEVEGFINVREQVLVNIQKQRLENLQTLLATDKENLGLQKEIKQVQLEIADIEEDSQGKRTEAINGVRALNVVMLEHAETQERILNNQRMQIDLSQQVIDSGLAIAQTQAASNNEISNSMDGLALKTDALSAYIAKKNKTTEDGIKATTASAKADKNKTTSAIELGAAVASLAGAESKAGKALAVSMIATNAAIGVSNAVKAGSGLVWPANLAAIFSGIAAVLTGIAQAKNVLGAFAGGGSFMTKGPTWLLVGDNPGGKERVDVTPVSGKGQTRIFNDGLAMAGGGSVNGSILAASSTAPIDAQFGLESALSELPPIKFVESDYSQFKQQIAFKEQISER